MLNPKLDHLSTKALLQKKRFSTVALITVWLGATFAIGATLFVWSRDGVLPETTFYTAIIALLASAPVFIEKKRIVQLLATRMLNS